MTSSVGNNDDDDEEEYQDRNTITIIQRQIQSS